MISLDNDTFFGLDSLTHLDLQRNSISLTDTYAVPLVEDVNSTNHQEEKNEENQSEDKFGKHNPGHPFAHLTQLKRLMLKSNRITKLLPVFDDMPNLRYLDLSMNAIFPWEDPVFLNNTLLFHLDLDHNQLTSINDAMVQDFSSTNLTEINMSENPLVCSCELYTSLDKLNPDKFNEYNEFSCEDESVEPKITRRCADFDPSDCRSSDDEGSVHSLYGELVIVSACVGVIVLVAVLLVVFMPRSVY